MNQNKMVSRYFLYQGGIVKGFVTGQRPNLSNGGIVYRMQVDFYFNRLELIVDANLTFNSITGLINSMFRDDFNYYKELLKKDEKLLDELHSFDVFDFETEETSTLYNNFYKKSCNASLPPIDQNELIGCDGKPHSIYFLKNTKLPNAIADENYELAAKIRDEILKLGSTHDCQNPFNCQDPKCNCHDE